jgi:alkylresorcinol/alkylpyrone synthase
VELCSLSFRTAAIGKADMISTALFGDGAAACVLRGGEGGFAQVTGSGETLWPETLDIMGWQMEETGLAVVLNRAIPAFARDNLRGGMADILARQDLALGDIGRLICHPGGARVVDAIERALDLGQGTLDVERDVLRDHGNMSAPTALFVLDRLRHKGLAKRSVLAALGPGFTLSTVTLEAA